MLHPRFHLPFVAAFLILWLPAAAAAATAPDETDWKTVPSELCQGLWIVPLTFEGEPGGTLRMVLDTGASFTAVDPDAVRRVFGRKVRAGKRLRLKKLTAGPLKIRTLPARTHQMDHLALALGTEMDGILGFPTFEDFLLSLDYAAGEVRVARGELPPVDGERIFRDAGTLRPYLVMEVGGQRIPLLLDSGSTGGLTLRESDPVRWSVEPRPLSASVRYREIRLEKAGRAEEDYRLGPTWLRRPVLELMRDDTRLVGWEILRHFHWVFDTRNRRIQITDGPESVEFPPLEGTGLAFRPVAEGFEVVRIFPGTPAASSQLQVGDVVVAVDGVPVEERGCRSLRDVAGRDSQLLRVDRDGESLDLRVDAGTLVP